LAFLYLWPQQEICGEADAADGGPLAEPNLAALRPARRETRAHTVPAASAGRLTCVGQFDWGWSFRSWEWMARDAQVDPFVPSNGCVSRRGSESRGEDAAQSR
jgi:hypothetical protein